MLIGWSISGHSSLKTLGSPGGSEHECGAAGLELKLSSQPRAQVEQRSQSATGHADRPVFNIRLKVSPDVAFAQII